MSSRYKQFSFAISGIYRYIQKIERDEMEKLGYKGAYAQYLIVIRSKGEGITSAELCRVCDKDKAAVSRVITEMEQKGLISRQGAAYRSRIFLTDEGRRAADFVEKRASSAVCAVELPDEARENFYKTLDFIAEKLQTISKDGIPKGRKSK